MYFHGHGTEYIEKHYIYNDYVMSSAVAWEPYNSLVKVIFKRQVCHIPNPYKTCRLCIVFNAFPHEGAQNTANSIRFTKVLRCAFHRLQDTTKDFRNLG